MINVNVRKQGGAAIITIPSDVLKLLGIKVGSALELNVDNGKLIARPTQIKNRKRYTLAELLQGVTPAKMKKLNDETKWAREGDSVGRELP